RWRLFVLKEMHCDLLPAFVQVVEPKKGLLCGFYSTYISTYFPVTDLPAGSSLAFAGEQRRASGEYNAAPVRRSAGRAGPPESRGVDAYRDCWQHPGGMLGLWPGQALWRAPAVPPGASSAYQRAQGIRCRGLVPERGRADDLFLAHAALRSSFRLL